MRILNRPGRLNRVLRFVRLGLHGAVLKKRQWIAGLVVLVALIALVIWARHRIHFDFAEFRSQLAMADWTKIAIGLACIYLGYVIRAARWALLLRHNKRVQPLSLVGTQVMGFTAVALIGRVADLVRPYLVAKKTNLELSSQIAVYIVERLCDMGAIAMLFSLAVLQLPQDAVVKAISHSGRLAAMSHNAPEVAASSFRHPRPRGWRHLNRHRKVLTGRPG